jgi:hypothetical protein
MSFDYFYGPDDAEQYSFYRIPKRLITGDEFQETSTEAKLLYGLMLDRLQLSIRNQWLDALNRVYKAEQQSTTSIGASAPHGCG